MMSPPGPDRSQMTKSISFVLLALAATGSAAQDQARVLSSEPVVQPVRVAHRVCGGERTAVQSSTSAGVGATVGAAGGGMAGNVIGSGEGRALATLLGAVLGALWGDRAELGRSPQVAHVRDCTWVSVQEDGVVGYDVRYEYAARQHQVRLLQDPGPTVTIEVAPAMGMPLPAWKPEKAMPRIGGEDFSGD